MSDEPREIRFVDFCAGLGGFHLGLSDAAKAAADQLSNPISFTCVAASELENDLRKCYVANFPEISDTYRKLHSESGLYEKGKAKNGKLPEFLNALPEFDERGQLVKIHGDMTCFLDESETGLRKSKNGKSLLPEHDLLCAGFPCQPFSKSGAQRGLDDTRGTVFHTIATILREKRPAFLLLENVGNFAKHDGGNTWSRVRRILEVDLGYDIVATEHVGVGDSSGLISPHHLGYPHHRERFFIVGQRKKPIRTDSKLIRELLKEPLSKRNTFPFGRTDVMLSSLIGKGLDEQARTNLSAIISGAKSPAETESVVSSQVTSDRVRCINHWAKLLEKLEELDRLGAKPAWKETMPSYPIWGYELDPWHWYPIHENPKVCASDLETLANQRRELFNFARKRIGESTSLGVDIKEFSPTGERAWLSKPFNTLRTADWIETWPAYAGKRDAWPRWKQRFIEQNREWAIRLWSSIDPHWLRQWLDNLYQVIRVPSYQKLEWNCKGEDLKIWKHILQFRPSGLRVKRLAHVPALIAMTTTQVPIVPRLNGSESLDGAAPGALGRHLIPSEALQLQGFPSSWVHPPNRERAFACLGNAVHVGVVNAIAGNWLFGHCHQKEA
ncbi:MAG: DNA (cytosine-5-)-methyltransferase [Rhodoferax sp.]|uniref:DNA cytosine methyltransferase n=1 Tax=Rhodoferax sp. TaxID=50421 RepID=UPI0018585E29|nr:DNA (cytosine-5-)-methyltransferase [Rhodoferax sp.]NMM15476.1 DNA (cytosine-5-)-methyltransferase [Rhodoferax sp.]